MANAPRPKTKSYAGRQVDLEMLKHVNDPAEFTRWRNVRPSVDETPRLVSGIEKAVQRYAKLFLTHLGSVKLAPGVGNELLYEVAHGNVNSQGYLDHLAIIANADTLDAIRLDDGNTDVYGSIPDDERITNAELKEVELIYDALTGGRVHVHVFITTAAGEGYTFVIPVAAGIT
jgi:hypothetical protein